MNDHHKLWKQKKEELAVLSNSLCQATINAIARQRCHKKTIEPSV